MNEVALQACMLWEQLNRRSPNTVAYYWHGAATNTQSV